MLRLTTLTGLLLFSPLAWSADNGFYLGLGVSQSEYGLDNPGNAQPFDDEDTGFKLIAGWRPLDSFGVEANYIDHGDATVPSGIACIALVGVPCPADTELTAETASLFAVGFLDFPFIDLFAKAGVTSWQFDGEGVPSGSGFSFDDDGTEFAWGVGVQGRLRSLAVRLEYESFRIIEDEELGTISLNLTWTFL